MDYFVNIVAAERGAAQDVADAECPLNEWRGIDAPGVTPAMLALIQSVLTGEPLADAFDRCEPVAWGEGGAAVLRLEEACVARLPDLDDEALEQCAEELVVSEDFESAGWQFEEAYSLLEALRDLAEGMVDDGEVFFVWVREA